MPHRGPIRRVTAIAAGCWLVYQLAVQLALLRDYSSGVNSDEVVVAAIPSTSTTPSALPPSSSSSCAESRSSRWDESTPLVCKLLGDGRTPSSIWREHFSDILEASMHPKDPARIHQNWTSQLLEMVNPELLEQGLRTSPSFSDMDRIVRIIDARMHNSSAPPLHVAVFGGSVTEGAKCNVLPSEIKALLPPEAGAGPIRGPNCQWVYRLGVLADHFFGRDVIKIYNLAAGGTGSAQAGPVLNYRLYPKNTPLSVRGPDVVINAYSTNDNHHSWQADANASKDFDHFYNSVDKAQGFLQTALRSRPCLDPPMVLFIDEYFGNAHELILGEEIRHEAVQMVSNRATVGYISSAFVVKPIVRAQSNETLFSPPWYSTKRIRAQRIRDAHFGMSGHLHVLWVVAYSLLKATADFCEDRHFSETDLSSLFVSQTAQHLLQSKIPPELDGNVSLKLVASLWQASETIRVREEQDYCQSSKANEDPCSFAFVATPAGTVRSAMAVNRYIKPFVESNNGWRGKNDVRNGWQNKLGFVADKARSSVVFRLANITNRISSLTLSSLKSYGDDWAKSEAEFNVTVWKEEAIEHATSFRIKGYHNQNTSISYPFRLDLGGQSAAPGRTLTLEISLLGGTTFKIISLMLCSR